MVPVDLLLAISGNSAVLVLHARNLFVRLLPQLCQPVQCYGKQLVQCRRIAAEIGRPADDVEGENINAMKEARHSRPAQSMSRVYVLDGFSRLGTVRLKQWLSELVDKGADIEAIWIIRQQRTQLCQLWHESLGVPRSRLRNISTSSIRVCGKTCEFVRVMRTGA